MVESQHLLQQCLFLWVEIPITLQQDNRIGLRNQGKNIFPIAANYTENNAQKNSQHKGVRLNF